MFVKQPLGLKNTQEQKQPAENEYSKTEMFPSKGESTWMGSAQIVLFSTVILNDLEYSRQLADIVRSLFANKSPNHKKVISGFQASSGYVDWVSLNLNPQQRRLRENLRCSSPYFIVSCHCLSNFITFHSHPFSPRLTTPHHFSFHLTTLHHPKTKQSSTEIPSHHPSPLATTSDHPLRLIIIPQHSLEPHTTFHPSDSTPSFIPHHNFSPLPPTPHHPSFLIITSNHSLRLHTIIHPSP
ncbi:hypothetical protein PoB_004519500 [Plakobranchus ocellatus]|uniref:Uncharacterized protein n=1 Tax=Plakobranchus ocellatus TaxID=259542 RepID=A0AAV4BHX4_9GAST|nr:hypothetical protein PoB_004519500 [Plakobranchus ocellatus]